MSLRIVDGSGDGLTEHEREMLAVLDEARRRVLTGESRVLAVIQSFEEEGKPAGYMRGWSRRPDVSLLELVGAAHTLSVALTISTENGESE